MQEWRGCGVFEMRAPRQWGTTNVTVAALSQRRRNSPTVSVTIRPPTPNSQCCEKTWQRQEIYPSIQTDSKKLFKLLRDDKMA